MGGRAGGISVVHYVESVDVAGKRVRATLAVLVMGCVLGAVALTNMVEDGWMPSASGCFHPGCGRVLREAARRRCTEEIT